MTARRELTTAIGLCLLGAAMVLLAVSRAWVSARVPAAAPLPARSVQVLGTHLAPGSRALALVGLAGVAALPATRAWGRTLVGVLLVAAGAGTGAVVVRALADRGAALSRTPAPMDAHFAATPGFGPWPYVALAGATLLTAAGALAVVRGRGWAAMSARYDAPVGDRPVKESSLWDALDRGEDPTSTRSDSGG